MNIFISGLTRLSADPFTLCLPLNQSKMLAVISYRHLIKGAIAIYQPVGTDPGPQISAFMANA
ncbi:hypothetical protein [Aeromonas allosaccharophila]|uniref:hypothetical protein n=1 Tax=Aeromonas allosaccharophila TaxID=656 RepID=UPI003985ABDC